LIFEEASWEAEKEIAELKSRLFETSATIPAKTPAEVLNVTLTYRLTYIDVIADKAARIIVNEETARRYEDWLNAFVKFEFEETLAWARSKAEGYPDGLLPYFNPDGFQLLMMGKLEIYKSKAASRVLRSMRSLAASEPPVTSGGAAQSTEGTTGSTGSPPVQKSSAANIGSGAVPAARRYGFEANMHRHKAIAGIVGRHDSNWENGSRGWRADSTLKGICTDLDHREIDIPENWKTAKTPSLTRVPLKGWADALELGYKKLITDQIRYSLEMARKKTTR
jgi:hypothetical protein